MRPLAMLAFAVISLAGCADRRPDPEETASLLTVLIAGPLASDFDRRDTQAADDAYRQAGTAPIGQRASWINPATKNFGSITAIREGITATGRLCRDYYVTLSVAGAAHDLHSLACWRPEGGWEVLS